MAYPDWVLKHKKKGMYVNKVNESTYRIYRGHSERVKGTNKVKRVVDEYIGTITEEKGLIPTKPRIKGEVRSLRVGGYRLLRWYCHSQIEGILSRFGSLGPPIWVSSALLLLYGVSDELVYEGDWLSIVHPDIRFPVAEEAAREAARVARGMRSTLSAALGEDLDAVVRASASVYRVWVNGQWVNAAVPDGCRSLAGKHDFRWEMEI